MKNKRFRIIKKEDKIFFQPLNVFAFLHIMANYKYKYLDIIKSPIMINGTDYPKAYKRWMD